MLCKVTHCAGRVSTTTRPHQLCWGDREMGTAISCTKCSQMSGLFQRVGRSSQSMTDSMALWNMVIWQPAMAIHTRSGLVARLCSHISTFALMMTEVNHWQKVYLATDNILLHNYSSALRTLATDYHIWFASVCVCMYLCTYERMYVCHTTDEEGIRQREDGHTREGRGGEDEEGRRGEDEGKEGGTGGGKREEEGGEGQRDETRHRLQEWRGRKDEEEDSGGPR